jgi:hypothetical protein
MLERQMMRKIKQYVDFRKQGIGYIEKGSIE